MAQLHYFVIAQQVIGDGGQTIVNMFNKITPSELPAHKPPITLVFGLVPDANEIKGGKIKIDFEVLSPHGKRLIKVTGTGKRTSKPPKEGESEGEISSSLNLSDRLVLTEEGVYTVKLFCNGKQLATNSFEVILDRQEKE